MSTHPAAMRDRRAERHARTKEEILTAAWRLAGERGIAGWSLRDLADEVGMRAPSLYGYFDSKNALYDSMFAQGYAQLIDRIEAARAERFPTPVDELRAAAHLLFDFAVENAARHTLLFLRTLPGFEPSPPSYALATRVLEEAAALMARCGLAERSLDLWTALLTGLATQQISNDPGGERWARRVDDAVDMFLAAHDVTHG